MWARTRPHCGRQLRCNIAANFRPQRKWSGRPNTRCYTNGPHTTYFQPPPPPPQRSLAARITRTVLWTTACLAVGIYGGLLIRLSDDDEQAMHDAVQEAGNRVHEMELMRAIHPIPLNPEQANAILASNSMVVVDAAAATHSAQCSSNVPCEDESSGAHFAPSNPEDKSKPGWHAWGIYDGHAGAHTAEALGRLLLPALEQQLRQNDCLNKPMNDSQTKELIKKTFMSIDDSLVNEVWRMPGVPSPLQMPTESEHVTVGSVAFSGSCAVLALYDPVTSVLRVANVGDSRAVLGRWDEGKQKYIAVPVSVDQTGFNQDEVARLEREHPGEKDIVDLKTGRLFGLAVTRAFGDARWKWDPTLTQIAHEKLFGPAPRPGGVIKTPPYLTAEPEITETEVRTGKHRDFMIMASDGLWDTMSSETAVACVQAWLDKNQPTDILDKMDKHEPRRSNWFSYTSTKQSRDESSEDTYFDEEEGCLKWKVEPKHFVVEDDNCSVHLIKNALGGKRRELFASLMTVAAPHSRKVRDDITCNVVFFGSDLHTIQGQGKSAVIRPSVEFAMSQDPRAGSGVA